MRIVFRDVIIDHEQYLINYIIIKVVLYPTHRMLKSHQQFNRLETNDFSFVLTIRTFLLFRIQQILERSLVFTFLAFKIYLVISILTVRQLTDGFSSRCYCLYSSILVNWYCWCTSNTYHCPYL